MLRVITVTRSVKPAVGQTYPKFGAPGNVGFYTQADIDGMTPLVTQETITIDDAQPGAAGLFANATTQAAAVYTPEAVAKNMSTADIEAALQQHILAGGQ